MLPQLVSTAWTLSPLLDGPVTVVAAVAGAVGLGAVLTRGVLSLLLETLPGSSGRPRADRINIRRVAGSH